MGTVAASLGTVQVMAKHIPIAELADMLHGHSNAWKALAMLKAYSDDSVTPVGSSITAIGGFVATSRAWQSAEVEWRSVLADYSQYGVIWFDPVECANGTGQFERVPSTLRNSTPMRFAKILLKYELMPVWAAVVNDD